MPSDHRLVKAYIDHLSSIHLTSPIWSAQSDLILSFLQAVHSPSFSDPHPTLAKSPSWKTLWGEIDSQDPVDGRWWVDVDPSKLSSEVRAVACEILVDLRSGLSVFLDERFPGRKIEVRSEGERGVNPFEESSEDVAWELLRTEPCQPIVAKRDKSASMMPATVTVRLKLTLRWREESNFKRHRHEDVYREFHIDAPGSPAYPAPASRIDTVQLDECWYGTGRDGGKEFEHLEYAGIPYVHHPSSSYNERRSGSLKEDTARSCSSEDTLVGSGEVGKMDELEVKVWAAQFQGDSEKRSDRTRWRRIKRSVL